MKASEVRDSLVHLLEKAAEGHESILITGPGSNAVLVGEEDWNAIQETLYLLSIRGIRESVREGLATPIEDRKTEPGW